MTDLNERILDDEVSDDEKAQLFEQLQTSQEILYFNGVNGATGTYAIEPMSGVELANIIEGKGGEKSAQPENLAELKFKREQASAGTANPIKPPNDPAKLDEAGWAVVFPYESPNTAAIEEALTPLLKLRAQQAGARFKIYKGRDGFGKPPGETKSKYLGRFSVGDGPADPEQMPYYVLIVGSPDEIPYSVQYQLDVMRGVGRIYFDTLQEYANYAASVVAAETGQVQLPRRAAFFGAASPDDKATQLSAKYLSNPLYQKIMQRQPFPLWLGDGGTRQLVKIDWQSEIFLAENATKAQLQQLLGGGDQTPAFLFTASHGLEFALGDKRQIGYQGALLCSDWPGPKAWRGEISRDHYFAAEDIASDVNLLGMVSMHFACFGAGTPRLDQFARQAGKKEREAIAERNFIASLPRKLLSLPRGGALAVIGHVERAWGYSFLSPTAGKQINSFESAIADMLRGDRVGWATENFNLRYADLAADLSYNLEELDNDPSFINPYELAAMWTANNDSRGYVLLGDPAVRIPFARPGVASDTTRQNVKPIEITATVQTATSVVAENTVLPASPAPEQPSADEMAAAVKPFPVRVAEEREGLTDSIKNFTSQLAESLKKAADDISSLEVITYSTDDLNKVTYNYDDKKLHGELKMRALTRIAFDGDVQVCVPEKDGKIDQAVWDVHLSMVKAAQENRAMFLQTMAELATKLIEMLGGK